jgi:hypothetical protein
LQIAPGSTVSELALSQMTGIGCTAIREAIQRLAREHLIVILSQRVLLVPEIDVKKQLKLLRTRREVERLVCRSAAKSATPEERALFGRLAAGFEKAASANDDVNFVRLDREFNELCATAARNEFAEGAMQLMHGLSRRFWYYHYKQAADLDAFAECFGEGDCSREFPTVDGALTEMDHAVQQIRDRNLLGNLPPEASLRVLDLVDRYHATADALEQCGERLHALRIERYWGDYGL